MPKLMEAVALTISVMIVECIVSVNSDTLSEVPMPKGASCPESILRPSLLLYLAPVIIAFLICNKKITSDIRLMYGN